MDFTPTALVFMITIATVRATHQECSIVHHLIKKEAECKFKMKSADAVSHRNQTEGCVMEWDGVSCWPAASEGQVVSVRCPLKPENAPVLITRTCTARGWSKMNLSNYEACFYEVYDKEEDMREKTKYLDTLKFLYSVGYGASMAALLAALLVFCCLRKLLCARNYIHLNLFVTFILRSLAVFIKDAVLFADKDTDHCTVSTVRCKAAVTFFHFCVLANFWWLLVEGLYLQTLLLFTFTRSTKLFWIFAIVGWGTPSVTIVMWALLKAQFDNEGCWDNLDTHLWWIIKVPILLSIFINFLIFINIIRVIVQKTKARPVTQTERRPFKRLVRSTLLLIPLFGVHYVVFALFPEHVGTGPRLYLELVLGSFQGFIVAGLYCFLNGEVQKEIQRMVTKFWPQSKTNAINVPTQEETQEQGK